MSLLGFALLATVVFVLVLRGIAHHLGMVDRPGGRKQHERPTPAVGGIAMFGAVALALYFHNGYVGNIWVVMAAAGGLVALGMFDDKHDLSVAVRLLIHAALSLVVILWADGKVSHLGSLFGSGDINLGALAIPFSVVAYVGGINAMNMIDGADGMAGKMALLTVAGVGLLAWHSGAAHLHPLVLAVSGALIGFLLFNGRIFVRRAWVFMGDGGSMWLGLVLGWFMAQMTHAPTAAQPGLVFWLFGIPVLDTLAVMARRIWRKASPFAADHTHVHHVFQKNGHTVARTVLLLTIAQGTLVGAGIVFHLIKAPGSVVFGAFVLLMAAYFYAMARFQCTPAEFVMAEKGKVSSGVSLPEASN